jgi:hypothetical protein
MFIAFSWGVGSKRSTNKQLAFELGSRLSIRQVLSKRMFLARAERPSRGGGGQGEICNTLQSFSHWR